MKFVALVAILMVAMVVGGVVVRRATRRHRRVRRLEKAESLVAAAVADGRMSTATGQALLQHLEGLRRICSRGDES